jgi:hypothetical protein
VKKCVVIVAAFNAQSWILSCVKGYKLQKHLDGWQYELRIGVDGCRYTAGMLQAHKIPFFYSHQNVGTYVMANSLLAVGPGDVYSRFDADDYMLPHYLKTVIPLAEKYGICHSPHKVNNSGFSKPRIGQVTFTADTLDKLGGFHSARCHCDRDFARRAALAGMDIEAMRADPKLKQALFAKGVSPRQITKSLKLGNKSQYRTDIRNQLSELRKQGQIKIVPETTELKWHQS